MERAWRSSARKSLQGGPAGRSPPEEDERAQRREPGEWSARGAAARERACRGVRRGEAPRRRMSERSDASQANGARVAQQRAKEPAGGSGGAKPPGGG